jgi:hypothetical protein
LPDVSTKVGDPAPMDSTRGGSNCSSSDNACGRYQGWSSWYWRYRCHGITSIPRYSSKVVSATRTVPFPLSLLLLQYCRSTFWLSQRSAMHYL